MEPIPHYYSNGSSLFTAFHFDCISFIKYRKKPWSMNIWHVQIALILQWFYTWKAKQHYSIFAADSILIYFFFQTFVFYLTARKTHHPQISLGAGLEQCCVLSTRHSSLRHFMKYITKIILLSIGNSWNNTETAKSDDLPH